MTGAEHGHHDDRTSLQGLCAALADDAARLDVLEKAFDFRGDVTLTLAGTGAAGGAVVTGYIFDRQRAATVADSYVRLLEPGSDRPRRVGFAEVARVEFGKDTAHGKTFDNWVKRYIEKKQKGETASIESEVVE